MRAIRSLRLILLSKETNGDIDIGAGQFGTVIDGNADRIQPADCAASAFYISNAWNTLVGNTASGGFAGFTFPNFEAPIGDHTSVDVEPKKRPLKEFDSNQCHSSGLYWDLGACIYVGGDLRYTNGGSTLRYQTGRNERSSTQNGAEVSMFFTNTRVWASRVGLNHWGFKPEVIGFEVYDMERCTQT